MKVLFITGNRSEYGLIKRLIKLATIEKCIDTFLFVTGDHLNNQTKTINEIENDGLKINGKIKCEPKHDSPLEILSSMGSATIDLSKHLEKITSHDYTHSTA